MNQKLFGLFSKNMRYYSRNLKQLTSASAFKSANRNRKPGIYHKDYENDTFRTLFSCTYLTESPVLPI